MPREDYMKFYITTEGDPTHHRVLKWPKKNKIMHTFCGQDKVVDGYACIADYSSTKVGPICEECEPLSKDERT